MDDDTPDITADFEGGRGRFDLGFERVLSNGTVFSAAGFYDGIGADHYEGYGLDIAVAMRF